MLTKYENTLLNIDTVPKLISIHINKKQIKICALQMQHDMEKKQMKNLYLKNGI